MPNRPMNVGLRKRASPLLRSVIGIDLRQFGRSRIEYGLDKIDEVVLVLAYVTLHDGVHVRHSCGAGLQEGERLYGKLFGRGSSK